MKDPEFSLQPDEALEYRLYHLLVSGCRLGVGGEAYQAPIQAVDSLVEAVAKISPAKIVALIAHARAVTSAPRYVARAAARLVANEKRRPLFGQVFHRVVKTVDDLLWVFHFACECNAGKPAKIVKELAAQWLELRLTDEDASIHFHMRKEHGVSLRDVILLAHPTYRGDDSPRIRYVLGEIPRPTDPLLLQASWRMRKAVSAEGVKQTLEEAAVRWDLVAGKISRNSPLWNQALPGMSAREILETLPGQVERIVEEEDYAPFRDALDRRPLGLGPVPFIEAAWRLRWPTDQVVQDILVQRAGVEQAALNIPWENLATAVDRSGGAREEFVASSLAATAFPTEGQSWIYDDIVEDRGVLPLMDELIRLRGRGGFRPELVLDKFAGSESPREVLIITMHNGQASLGFEQALTRVRKTYPALVVVRIFPKGTPPPHNASLVDRYLIGADVLHTYWPLLVHPVEALATAYRS